ncbi:flagellar motor switch protein FliM [Anoxybacter fermentans]|uniref:Flagellar motor switch protein FliM n=1 Tax=Anoxybacter fermentans TaxID=1323375 RepID=A0A3S9SZX4_9FIRM|nr:flagellar motor switch protein FliM [Anoxybacter fermentans]AZR73868.1 flagellar motor switch protein FliM [Anoxybacter fermentans]
MAEVLSQSEIDALLAALSSGSVDVEEIKGEEKKEKVRVYDFRTPDKLSKDQLRTLQMLHENFCRLLTTTLSAQIRSMVDVQVVSIEQLAYDEFIRSLPEPTILSIVDMAPLEGQILIEIAPAIGFAIIDRLFGGKGIPSVENRPFSDIEEIVLEKVIKWFLSCIPEAWENVVQLTPKLKEIESNPQFVQIIPHNDVVILVTLEARVAQGDGLINICIPYITIEPIVNKLNAQYWFSSIRKEQTAQNINALKRRIGAARLPIYAILGTTEITVRDLINLRPGDVIPLVEKTKDPVIVRVGNKPKFIAKPGTRNNRMAVKILDIINGEEESDDWS